MAGGKTLEVEIAPCGRNSRSRKILLELVPLSDDIARDRWHRFWIKGLSHESWLCLGHNIQFHAQEIR